MDTAIGDRRTFELASAGIKRLLHDRGLGGLRKLLLDYLRQAAARGQATLPTWNLYHRLRKRYFQQALDNPRWRDYDAGPPQNGWVWDIDSITVDRQRHLVSAWIPPRLHYSAEPKDRHLFDIPQTERPAAEKAAILALLHEAQAKSGNIYVEEGEQEDVTCLYAAHLWLTQEMVRRERESGIRSELDFPVEKWLKDVEAELTRQSLEALDSVPACHDGSVREPEDALASTPTVETPPVEQPRQLASTIIQGNEQAQLRAILHIYTSGAATERFEAVVQILADKSLTVDAKLAAMNKSITIPATTSAQQLASALGVSKTAVVNSDWWQRNRAGQRESAAGRRGERLQEQGRNWEANRRPDKDDD